MEVIYTKAEKLEDKLEEVSQRVEQKTKREMGRKAKNTGELDEEYPKKQGAQKKEKWK